MLERTKKHRTETLYVTGPSDIISRLREYARKIGAGIIEADSISAEDISPELKNNPGGTYLRGIRLREELTQEKLSALTGISRANISAMEHGRRPIGKELAKKLADTLKCDYRRFL